MSRFWSQLVHELTPYVPGEQPKNVSLIKLNTNENPYGPSPEAIKAMAASCNEHLRLYPDPNSDELRSAIAEFYQIDMEKVFVGNGSDEVLAHAFQGLLKQDKPILFPDITYSFYPVYCGLYGIEYETLSLNEQYAIDLKDYERPNGGIIIANPNAPTGLGLDREAIEVLLRRNQDSVVVVDEAYIDFGGQSAVELVDIYPNLLVIQTLSKSRSLAGLRVGFAIGHPDLIEALDRVKNSFNSYPMDRTALAGAAASIRDKAYFDTVCAKVIRTRELLTARMKNMGFEVLPSQTNFVFARHPDWEGSALMEKLRAEGILVRHFSKPRIDQFLRISIGTDEECNTLVAVLGDLLREADAAK